MVFLGHFFGLEVRVPWEPYGDLGTTSGPPFALDCLKRSALVAQMAAAEALRNCAPPRDCIYKYGAQHSATRLCLQQLLKQWAQRLYRLLNHRAPNKMPKARQNNRRPNRPYPIFQQTSDHTVGPGTLQTKLEPPLAAWQGYMHKGRRGSQLASHADATNQKPKTQKSTRFSGVGHFGADFSCLLHSESPKTQKEHEIFRGETFWCTFLPFAALRDHPGVA